MGKATVNPIGATQQREVERATARYVRLAGRLLDRPMPAVPVLFDLSGTAAGMFVVRGASCWIRYNPWIFGKYYAENLRDTVPHEVAHYVVHVYHGRRGIKPHGPEWRAVMALFGVDPGVTFKRDLSDIPQRRQRTHLYRCGCRDHQLSSTRHNRVLRGEGCYQCRYCNGELVYLSSPKASRGR